MDLLKQEQEIAETEAGLEAIMLKSSGGFGASSFILRSHVDKSQLTMEYVQEQNMRIQDSVYVGEDDEKLKPQNSMSLNTVFNPQLPSQHLLQQFVSHRPTSGNQFDKFKDNAVNQSDVEVSPADSS